MDSQPDSNQPAPLRMLAFWLPLAIQAASQSLSWPLVGSIATHGRLGPVEYATFSQTINAIGIINAVGIGLVTTGMVFAKTRKGMRNFTRLVLGMCAYNALAQLLFLLPPFGHVLFETILGLKGELVQVARNTMLLTIPMQVFFMMRPLYLAPLLNAKRSAPASHATLLRIALTLGLCPLFLRLGLNGHRWAVLAMTLGAFTELAFTAWFARPYMAALEEGAGEGDVSLGTQFRFTIPLSFGGVMLNASVLMIAAYLARTPDPSVSLPIHYVVAGLIAPFGFSALRMQAVTIAFPPAEVGRRTLLSFVSCCAVLLCSCSFLAQVPAVANWYFGSVQNLDAQGVLYAKRAILILALVPVIQAFRGHAEGLAALRRRPNAILSSQATYCATMLIVLSVLVWHQRVPGYMVGVIALVSAQAMALLSLRIALAANDIADRFGISPHSHTMAK